MVEKKDRNVYKDMDIDGNLIIERWKLLDNTKKMIYDLEKCVGCSLCYVICPNHAIEIGPVPEIAQNIIEDMPPVLIDTDKCSFCFMCEKICINSVYEILDGEGNEIDKKEFPKLKQMWEWDEKTCKPIQTSEVCLKCKIIRDPINSTKGRHFARDLSKVVRECPTKSMVFKSPFKGEVIILKNQLDRCDPNGCKACVNICPTESFFIPQSAEDIQKFGKIACNEETCMYCGACENSCPEKLIIVKRDGIDMEIPEESIDKPWLNRWRTQFEKLLLSREELNRLECIDNSKILVTEQPVPIDIDDPQISPKVEFTPEDYNREIAENKPKLQIINDLMKKKHIRYFIHKKQIDKLKKNIKKELQKN